MDVLLTEVMGQVHALHISWIRELRHRQAKQVAPKSYSLQRSVHNEPHQILIQQCLLLFWVLAISPVFGDEWICMSWGVGRDRIPLLVTSELLLFFIHAVIPSYYLFIHLFISEAEV